MQQQTSSAPPQLEIAWTTRPGRARLSPGWILRHLLTIILVHVAVLATTYFLLLLGDALFTTYAIGLGDAVFVSTVAQVGWLQRMAANVKEAIAVVVGVSAVLQMLVFAWRVIAD